MPVDTEIEDKKKIDTVFCLYFKRNITREKCRETFKEDPTVRKLSCIGGNCKANQEKEIISRIMPIEDINYIKDKEGGELMVQLVQKEIEVIEGLKKLAKGKKFGKEEIERVAKSQEIKAGSVRAYITGLVSSGVVKRIGTGDYQITDTEYTLKEGKAQKTKKEKKKHVSKEKEAKIRVKTEEELDQEIAELGERIEKLKMLRDNYDYLVK